MKFLKNNILNILSMTFLFTIVMLGDVNASAFSTASNKLKDTFNNAKIIIFIIGGFSLIALSILSLVIFILMFIRGTQGANKYGPEPEGNDKNLGLIILGTFAPAILGMFVIAGIAGYAGAMGKYRTNKTVDQISRIAANTRILYGAQSNYTPMNDDIIRKAKLMPAEMITTYGYKNEFGGEVILKPSDKYDAGDKKAFIVEYHDIPRDVCVDLATLDWGVGSGGGLIALMATSDDGLGLSNVRKYNCQNISRYGVAVTCGSMMSASDAAGACTSELHNTLIFKFY